MGTVIVDAHHHVWDLGVRHQPWLDGDGLAPLRRDFLLADYPGPAAGVTASVVVQTVVQPEETPELLALAAGSDLVAGVVGWADLADPGIADVLAELRALPGGGKLAAVRHQVQSEPDPRWLLRPDVLRGLRAVAAAGLVYDLVVTAEQLGACAEAAAAVPDLVFVLDHLGKPPIAGGGLEPWATDLCRLAALPNPVAKLSGLVTEADWRHWRLEDQRPYADVAFGAFGADRLMFGSDWPVCTLAASYDEVLAAARELTSDLSAGERDAIFAGTATRVYRLCLPVLTPPPYHLIRERARNHQRDYHEGFATSWGSFSWFARDDQVSGPGRAGPSRRYSARTPAHHTAVCAERASWSYKGWPGYEMGTAAAPRSADEQSRLLQPL
ncbi:MAG TPA: amidohydrolase family protein [Streptosporangiaceae bacterium]|nr:amidohydrolase family protein [Streptosporangiaceae bacterium]